MGSIDPNQSSISAAHQDAIQKTRQPLKDVRFKEKMEDDKLDEINDVFENKFDTVEDKEVEGAKQRHIEKSTKMDKPFGL